MPVWVRLSAHEGLDVSKVNERCPCHGYLHNFSHVFLDNDVTRRRRRRDKVNIHLHSAASRNTDQVLESGRNWLLQNFPAVMGKD